MVQQQTALNSMRYPSFPRKPSNYRGPTGVRFVGARRARQLRRRGHLVIWHMGFNCYAWGPGILKTWNDQMERPKDKRLRWRLRPWGPEVVPTRRHGSTDMMSRARVSSPF